jgi:hypothetical protein
MLHYPKIPSAAGCPGGRCVAFDKIDGTNLHWSWDRDFGWHAFGTRRDEFNLTEAGVRLFHQAHPGLEDCAELFRASLAGPLEAVFRAHPGYLAFAAFKAFTEYAGPHSFAGQHQPGDPRELILFDVFAEGFGLLGPEQFLADFGDLKVPRVVFQGRFSGRLTEDVRAGRYGVAEGVVVKGGSGGSDLWMVKIKTLAYQEKLKHAFAGAWRDHWE